LPHDPNLGDLRVIVKALRLEAKSRESPREIQARIARESAEAAHQRHKDLLITWAVLITVGVVSAVCIMVVFLPGVPPENARWATTLLTTIVSAGLGYMTGKNSK
jgi:hypothetical protein